MANFSSCYLTIYAIRRNNHRHTPAALVQRDKAYLMPTFWATLYFALAVALFGAFGLPHPSSPPSPEAAMAGRPALLPAEGEGEECIFCGLHRGAKLG